PAPIPTPFPYTTLFRSRAANNLAAVATLTYQQDLMTFSARLSSARQVSEVRVRGWNPSAKAAILGVGHAGDETTRMGGATLGPVDRKSTRLNSSHVSIS